MLFLFRYICCMLVLVSWGVSAKPVTLTILPELSSGFERNYNPFLPNVIGTAHEFVFEPLIIFREGKTVPPAYRLATSYAMNKALKVLTISLRDGVKWSDGYAFSGRDVAFTIEMMRKHPELDYNGISEWVERTQVLPGNKIKVFLKKPNAQFIYQLVSMPVVPEHQWKFVKDPATFTNSDPVGTGPFTQITSFSQDDVVQCRNPFYWQQKALHIDCISYRREASNDALISALAQGRYDWTSAFVPDIERNYASYSQDFHYYHAPSSTVSLMMNFGHANPVLRKVMQNIDFRRGLSMAIRRDLLINIAAYGQAEAAHFASGMSQKYVDWIDRNIAEQFVFYIRHHPIAARESLDKAKTSDRNGDGWRDLPDGSKLALSIMTPEGWTDFNTAAELVAESLQTAGIQVTTEKVPFNTYLKRLSAGDYTLAITNYPDGITPYRYFTAAFYSRNQGPEHPRYAHHFYKSPYIDNLLQDYLLADTLDKQRQIIHALQKETATQLITVPLFNAVESVQYSTKRFTGWFRTKNGAPDVPLVWPQWQERLLQVLALRPVEPDLTSEMPGFSETVG
ncbi:ABC transporter substrate-binding protein [Parasalinivibrio latis]|uniref:ABC transporter substrate-binding protein n=1 Tax=Parasalinivibrio latis TaxID=2952610 RepID=UPI0030E10AA5